MFRKKKWVLSALCFVAFASGLAQVPVSQEPMHHKVVDNGHIRLLDVHIRPGDTTQFHIHSTPSVFLLLTAANTGSQVVSEEDHSASPIPHYGNIWFEGFYLQPRIHRVYNRDTHEFHVMDIELTHKKYNQIDSRIRQEAFTFLFDEKPVRAYRMNLTTAGQISIPARKADILIVQMTDSVESIRINEKSFFLKGDYLFIPSGVPVEIEYHDRVNAEFAFFELK